VLIIWYLVGIAGFLIQPVRPLFQVLTPWGMLMAAIVVIGFHEPVSRSSYLVFASIALLGFIAELIGVNSQLLFGNYSYGKVLGFKVLETPLVIGLNWLVLIYAIAAWLTKFRRYWFFSIIGTGCMVAFDWPLEPVAGATGMVNWEGEQNPNKKHP